MTSASCLPAGEFDRRLDLVVLAIREETKDHPFFLAKHIARATGMGNKQIGRYLAQLNYRGKGFTIRKVSRKTWRVE